MAVWYDSADGDQGLAILVVTHNLLYLDTHNLPLEEVKTGNLIKRDNFSEPIRWETSKTPNFAISKTILHQKLQKFQNS